MTLTTVGYHKQPQTFLGKLSCGLCALCGVFIITLPIPIGGIKSIKDEILRWIFVLKLWAALLSVIETNCGEMRLPPERDWRPGWKGKTPKKKSSSTFLNPAGCQVEWNLRRKVDKLQIIVFKHDRTPKPTGNFNANGNFSHFKESFWWARSAGESKRHEQKKKWSQ